MAVTVRMENVTKRYGDTRAVDRLDLRADAGRATVLLGPSGCGKTTTLRLLAGLSAPDEGAIHFGDLCVNDPVPRVPPRRRRVGMVFQSLALWPHMTVEGNLRFAARAAPPARLREVLDLVELGDRAASHPSELSGGEQQRVALARALVTDPQVLLLDEPLASLDEALRKRMLLFMADLKDRLGVTTVFVTHSQKEALAFADRLVVMRRGRVLQQGEPREVYRRPASAFVARFLGDSNLLRAEVDADGRVRTVLGSFLPRGAAPPAGATALLRPEDVEVLPAGRGAATGRVQRCAYEGSHAFLDVEVEGETVRARTDEPVPPGEERGLRWRTEPVVLPADGDGIDGPEREAR